MFAFCLSMLFFSCSESDPVSNLYEANEQSHAFDYLNSHETPPIMFSYNVYNDDTNEMLSLLIDNEGNVKTITQEKNSARENLSVLQSDLEALKQNAEMVDGLKIDVDDLVNNFSLLRTADQIVFDVAVQTEKPQIHTSVYGYFYLGNYSAYGSSGSSSATNECGEGGSSSSTGSSGSFRSSSNSFSSILLEQTVDFSLVQENERAKWLINWMNGLASQLDMTTKESSN